MVFLLKVGLKPPGRKAGGFFYCVSNSKRGEIY